MKLLNILKYQGRRLVRPVYRRTVRGLSSDGFYEPKLPMRKVKRILRQNGLGFDAEGNPTWFYGSYDNRNSYDELVKAELDYILKHVSRDADILVTGCGTGVMQMWLVQQGYSKTEGFDYLQNVVTAANQIADVAGVKTTIWRADGFQPGLVKQYDLITVLHWLFSAWHGNYGNTPAGGQDREVLLRQFLSQYSDHLRPGGLMMLELIDAISDFGVPPSPYYPIRHTFEQVASAASANGMQIKTRMFNGTSGHLPRMMYVLERLA